MILASTRKGSLRALYEISDHISKQLCTSFNVLRFRVVYTNPTLRHTCEGGVLTLCLMEDKMTDYTASLWEPLDKVLKLGVEEDLLKKKVLSIACPKRFDVDFGVLDSIKSEKNRLSVLQDIYDSVLSGFKGKKFHDLLEEHNVEHICVFPSSDKKIEVSFLHTSYKSS